MWQNVKRRVLWSSSWRLPPLWRSGFRLRQRRRRLKKNLSLRRVFGIKEGSEIIAEETSEGILLRPAMTVALEIYGPERKAEFLLSNAVDAGDYARAVAEVRALGIDPDAILHERPENA